MIDAHQHFWTVSRTDYGWLTPANEVLYRDFAPEHLAPLLATAGITQTVLVQAAPTVAETHYLLAIADRTPWVGAVVGWVDLAAPDVDAVLDSLCEHRALRGVRPMLQDLPDDAWLLRPEVAAGVRALAARGLRFDALVRPRHLPHLLRFLDRHPDLPVVIDHAAKPEIAARRRRGWADDLRRIAANSRAVCKLSGLVTEAGADWQARTLAPYVDHLLDIFGSERLLWGSDWPVVDLAGGFARWRHTSIDLLRRLDLADRQRVFHTNAAKFYGL